jgi:hypothetical protein
VGAAGKILGYKILPLPQQPWLFTQYFSLAWKEKRQRKIKDIKEFLDRPQQVSFLNCLTKKEETGY